jgi:hypothetical protein
MCQIGGSAGVKLEGVKLKGLIGRTREGGVVRHNNVIGFVSHLAGGHTQM